MAYNELIKNFEKIRGYMRDFHVYGFKGRDAYNTKSARSYDNERRRVESWLGDSMRFRQDANGKTVFLTVDNREVSHNPLYSAFKARSFTDHDITLHFFILDLLADGETYTVHQIIEEISNEYLSHFNDPVEPDESTVRKKLKEYEQAGLLESVKVGRELAYRREKDYVNLNSWRDAISFFSEIDPMGVIGSYLLDKFSDTPDVFSYKHHYLLHALDSEILDSLLQAIREQRCVDITIFAVRKKELRDYTVLPVKTFISTQSGRQYLLAYHYRLRRPMFFRTDNIRKVKIGPVEQHFDRYGRFPDKLRENLWGVSLGVGHSLDHIEMLIHVGKNEEYIVDRLNREKRCGRIEQVDDFTYRFAADVFDATEMLPWIRTFTGRIISLECSNKSVGRRFYEDLETMQGMYKGGEDHSVQ